MTGAYAPPTGHAALLSVARDRAVHDTRVAGAHRLIAEAEAVEHAGPEVLEHHIARRREPQHDLAPGVDGEIDRDAPLSAVLLGEVDRKPADTGLRRARRGRPRAAPTLMTSAPRSASAFPHDGPDSTRERSRTRIPASGLGGGIVAVTSLTAGP